MQKTNQNSKVLFDVFPIAQQLGPGMMLNYRFQCMPTNVSYAARLLFLNERREEGYLVCEAANPSLVLAYQTKNEQHYMLDSSTAFIRDPKHVLYSVVAESGGVIDRAYQIAVGNGIVEHFFDVCSRITKTALKLQYKKTQTFGHFDEVAFINSTLIRSLSEVKETEQTYIKLQTECFFTDDMTNHFLYYFLGIGKNTSEFVPIETLHVN